MEEEKKIEKTVTFNTVVSITQCSLMLVTPGSVITPFPFYNALCFVVWIKFFKQYQNFNSKSKFTMIFFLCFHYLITLTFVS